ncbi:MAG: BMP family ABC transporter substrate-binding protein [Anaerolineales bacterium]|nr:BMP family ABC transporter substrate-binding protein [Anaerolineales bacterium]
MNGIWTGRKTNYNVTIHKFFILVVLALTSCANLNDCFSENVFCAALVTDTLGINDHGINQDTWAGLEESKANGVVDQIEYIESVDTRDYEKNIIYFAEKGYDVIITSGIGLLDETFRSADLYPDSPEGAVPVFVGMNQPYEETRSNIISITFAEDQMGFAAGALAARISETRIVGAACETSGIDSMWRYCEGFRAGAQFVDEDIKVMVIYRDDGSSEKLFIDEAWGRETAQKLIQRGADVIFAAGGATAQSALRAASEVEVDAIGTERDQSVILGEEGSSVITSIYGNASFEVQSLMQLIKDGNANEPRLSQIKYVPFDEKFPESFTKEMDTLLVSLWKRVVKTNVNNEKP